MDLKSKKQPINQDVDRFFLNPPLTRPIFLNFLVDKLEETLYTDSAGCFLVKLD